MKKFAENKSKKLIIILGGATAKIGDPTGKSKTRTKIPDHVIENNQQKIHMFFKNFFQNSNNVVIMDNTEWLNKISYLEFLELYASKISVNKLVKTDIIANALSENRNFTFTEMNYMILQGLDFYHLRKHHNCYIQLGGQDQWINMLNGIDLCGKFGYDDTVCFTHPLLTDKNNIKFGKSEGNAIWLDNEKTSAVDFWNWWRSIDDELVDQFCSYCEIINNSDINKSKENIANFMTELFHKDVHTIKNDITIFNSNDINFLLNIKEESSLKFIINKKDISNMTLKEFICFIGKSKSNSESKNLILQGSVYINNQNIKDQLYNIPCNNFVLQIGKTFKRIIILQ